MEIDLLKLNYSDQIDVDSDITYSDDYIKDSGIIHLNNVHVSGTIKTDIEFNYDVNFKLKGEMIINDSLTGEEVPYKFNTNIEEFGDEDFSTKVVTEFSNFENVASIKYRGKDLLEM